MVCQYTVVVFSSPENHLQDISIQITGQKGTSEPQRLVNPVSTISSPHLGLIWQVELKLHPSLLGEGWFCDKLYIITPEREKVLFKCQRYLDYRNPSVVLAINQEPQSVTFINSHTERATVVPRFPTPFVVERYTVQKTEEYTVSAKISQHSYNHINIQLIGTDGVSSPQPLSDSPFKITCPPLGKLLLVKLTVKIHAWEIWPEYYCYKVTVTMPGSKSWNFPCYRYLDRKNPEMELTDNAFIDVPRTHQDINPLLIEQRKNELEKRQNDFRWKVYAEKLPKYIDADSSSELPKELGFSLKKEVDIISVIVKIFAKLEYETLLHWKKTWTDLDELKKLLPNDRTEITEYVIQHWDKDEFFGFQLLNGLNPMMIRRCKELPEGAAFTDEIKSGLSEEMKNEKIFICNYERQRDLKANIINHQQQYLNSPIVLLRLKDDKLIPFAIQVTQDEGKEHTVVLKDDNPDKWTLAKTIVRAAEFNELELNFHLLRTHLLGEVFTVATYRNLPSSHPLFKLLLPHTRYNLAINISARNKLISEGGIFALYTAIGKKSSMIEFLQRAMSSITYSSLCLPDDIKERGLENIPHFYYRDDGTCLWKIILTFVRDVLQIFYKSDDDVRGDTDLQKWISEIFWNGFNSNTKSGIPSKLRSLEELYKFVTMIIFTVSGQHAAVNNGQFDYGFWMPNFPSSLRANPFEKDASEKALMDMLPDVRTTLHGLAVLKTLSTKSTDFLSLGDYEEELFDNEDIKAKIGDFKENLGVLKEGIHIRNQLVPKPGYTFLNPTNVSNSIDL